MYTGNRIDRNKFSLSKDVRSISCPSELIMKYCEAEKSYIRTTETTPLFPPSLSVMLNVYNVDNIREFSGTSTVTTGGFNCGKLSFSSSIIIVRGTLLAGPPAIYTAVIINVYRSTHSRSSIIVEKITPDDGSTIK